MSLRQIVLDTETTGTAPQVDRIVEIGCVELVDGVPTGREWHRYIDPKMKMPEGAFRVHGLSDEFLRGKPVFAMVAHELLTFIGDAQIVAHNASFDLRFLNAEFARLRLPNAYREEDHVDTLAMARKKFPGAPAKLDNLVSRFGLITPDRTTHGALLDARILVQVYAELRGDKQRALDLAVEAAEPTMADRYHERALRDRRPFQSKLTDAERERHAAFVAGLGPSAIWRDYITEEEAA